MSERTLTPPEGITVPDTVYTARVEHDPAAPDDPISWAYSIYDNDDRMGGGWAGTEAEAHEYAQQFLDAYFVTDDDEDEA